MNISDTGIDGGKAFDWGKTSQDYAKYRDIYPQEFYEKIVSLGLCTKGQRVLDIGTGTGVIPRNMYRYGADWTGTDISENQIQQAVRLAQSDGMNITFKVSSAEKLDFPYSSFDTATACQCFFYFDPSQIYSVLSKLLAENGRLLIAYMSWIPSESEIARKSEELVLKYNPQWTGADYKRTPIYIHENAYQYFSLVHSEQFDLNVRFTRESWNGRIKACRGTGASLSPSVLAEWEKEHISMLNTYAPSEFDVIHGVSLAVLENKK